MVPADRTLPCCTSLMPFAALQVRFGEGDRAWEVVECITVPMSVEGDTDHINMQTGSQVPEPSMSTSSSAPPSILVHVMLWCYLCCFDVASVLPC